MRLAFCELAFSSKATPSHPGRVPQEFLDHPEDGPPDFRPVQIAFVEEIIGLSSRFQCFIFALAFYEKGRAAVDVDPIHVGMVAQDGRKKSLRGVQWPLQRRLLFLVCFSFTQKQPTRLCAASGDSDGRNKRGGRIAAY